MGLLDGIATATGNSTSIYLGGGRHLIRVTELYFRDTDDNPELAGTFRLNGELVKTNNAKHSEHVGNVVTANISFKEPKLRKDNLARMRRILTKVLSSQRGETVTEDQAAAEAVKCVGPSQPCVGTYVVILGTEKFSKTRKNDDGSPGVYTLYEAAVPTDEDIEGLGE